MTITKNNVVLLVDDQPDTPALIQKLLEGMAELQVVQAGQEAIAYALTLRPAMIMINASMSTVNGYELCRCFRAETAFNRTPIVMMMAEPDHAQEIKAYDSGACGCIFPQTDFQVALRQMHAYLKICCTLREGDCKQQALFNENTYLAEVMDSLSDAVIAVDTQGCVRFMNPVAEQLTGWRLGQAQGKPIDQVMALTATDSSFHCDNPVYAALERLQAVSTASAVLECRDGTVISIENSATPIISPKNGMIGAVVVFRDVGEAQALASRMSQLVNHDVLTKLPGRKLLEERAEGVLKESREHGVRVAMLVVDIDHFKTINEAVGHAVGDILLVRMAKRLSRICGPFDMLSRPGGDEFVMLLPAVSEERLAEVVDQVLEQFNHPIWIESERYDLSVSIGAAIFPDDSDSVESLYKHADVAMYEAKRGGRARAAYFSKDLEQAAFVRHRMERELRVALEQQRFELFYQPKIDARDGRIVGVEALLRMRDEQGTLVPPGDFIPLAESSGLIVPIGNWVLEQACSDAARWQADGYRFDVSVNISAVQFQETNFNEQVLRVLKDSAVDSRLMELEITEGVLAKSINRAATTMLELKETGLQISMDDFGTGYSSLSYLKRFPFDVIKIDQSFIRGMLDDPGDAAIVESIIRIADSLNLEVVAEGVENETEIQALLDKGCHIMQGYYYSRPLPFPQLCDYLVRTQKRNSGSEY